MSNNGKKYGIVSLQESFHSTGTGLTESGYLAVGLVDSSGAEITNLGGGSTGGGDSTYGTASGDYTATPTNASYKIVLSVDTLNGQAITAEMIANGSVNILDATDSEWHPITLDNFTWTFATKTIDITNCTNAFELATADVASVLIVGPDKAYDSSTDTDKVTVDNPEWEQHAQSTVVSDTDITATTHDYDFALDDYKNLSLTSTLTDADGTLTMTLWVANGATIGAATFVQVYGYDDSTDTVSNSWAVTNGALSSAITLNNSVYDFARVRIIASGATNTVLVEKKLTY